MAVFGQPALSPLSSRAVGILFRRLFQTLFCLLRIHFVMANSCFKSARLILLGWSVLLALLVLSCKKESNTPAPTDLLITQVLVNELAVANNGRLANLPPDTLRVRVVFNKPINAALLKRSEVFFGGLLDTFYNVRTNAESTELQISTRQKAPELSQFRFYVGVGPNLGGKIIDGFNCTLVTSVDSTPKFPLISDEELLTKVQLHTFRYFWDYAHPVSGLARERLGSNETVTSGGSGFGLMAILVGIERGFITRSQAFDRLKTIVTFLNNPQTETFHGAYPHWLNGSTGKAIAFSTKDNGGDLVETAFLFQGLLTVREYFKNGLPDEQALCDTIQKMYERVEWNWYTQNNQNVLYWHWSPQYNWQMNHPIQGWNEALMVYVLAASSPTYSIGKTVYEQGWARNGAIRNGKTFYNNLLPLGEDRGGPLFFAHYSFLGLDPGQLADQYANYWQQNIAHARINYAYCVANPRGNAGYSAHCWGLTASDVDFGYTASSPNNDVGVIAPTAALASFPYTPDESMQAMKFFYYVLGDKIWGDYGFKDAFNLNTLWFATSYLAIDQGPIVVMIENHRSGLLWNLFMQNTQIQQGLTKLGFTY